jgi:hypothetical protein
MNASQRRAEITANIVERTGIDEAMIARLVHFLDSNNRAIRQHRPRLGCGRWFRPTFLAEEITGSKHRCFLALRRMNAGPDAAVFDRTRLPQDPLVNNI